MRLKTDTKARWLFVMFIIIASFVFSGCDNGSLGAKYGVITGYVLNVDNNQPVPEVLIKAKGTLNSGVEHKSTYTAGDGSFTIPNVKKGSWEVDIEKYGYILATDSADVGLRTVEVNIGETVSVSVIKVYKTEILTRGTLKAYPVDAVTGRPITNFTVTQATPYNQRKSKFFESAADFRDTGWTNLDGGEHEYVITARNYKDFSTAEGENAKPVSIGPAPANLGTIYLEPLTVDISGSLRLPGYVLDAESQNISIWAEASGKRVASYTTTGGDSDAFNGSLNFTLTGVPVTAGSVTVKSKVRGYEIVNLKSALAISAANPGGTIAIGETDYIRNITPITRDVRVVLRSTKPDDGDEGSFRPGSTAEIFIKQGGETTSTKVTVQSNSYYAEGHVGNVITGYPLVIMAQNTSEGYYSVESEPTVIPEDGTSVFTIFLQVIE